jgi:hypothetical protein
MWFLAQGVVLTKDNILKKKIWKGNPNCYFCGALETSDHLFFQCLIAKVIWEWWLSTSIKVIGHNHTITPRVTEPLIIFIKILIKD